MMPKKDGFAVVTAIRENISTSHIPVVLLTAKAALESRLEGLERGADAYLTKPFSPEELVLRIRKLIELRQSLQRRYQNQEHEIDKNTESFPKEDAFITNLKAFITENIDNSNLTVVEISEHFFMSRVQLYRKLKALTDDSVSVFIRKVRLEVALELIKAKELNLSEIAYQTGFSSPAYFSTAFKQQYGKSPSEIGSN
jgi:YesN/AraC family two-component response regulator